MNTAPKLLFLLRDAIDSAWTAGHLGQNHDGHEAARKLADAVAALAPPSGEGVDRKPQRNPAFVGEWHAKAVALGYDGVADMLDSVERGEPPQHIAAVLGATPQSAPADVIGHDEVVVHREILENADAALAISNHKGSAWSEHESPRYEIRELLGLPYEKRTTPPPASQERGRLQVFHCREADDGEAGCAKWCGNRTYCPVSGEAEPSPPSSAAEGPKAVSDGTFGAFYVCDKCHGTGVQTYTKPGFDGQREAPCPAGCATGAAEQAKPDDIFAGIRGNPAFTLDGLIKAFAEAEQAQAGELQFVREALSRLAEKVAYLDGSEVTITKADACAIGQELLRRLAGGVTDKYDELLYAVHSKYPNETRHETALRYIRERENSSGGAAMVAALGAK